MSMDFPANPTVGQIAQLGAFNYQCVSAAPQPIVWDVIGDAEVQNIGGFNVQDRVSVANGVTHVDFDLLPGYDYHFEIENAWPTTQNSLLAIDFAGAEPSAFAGLTGFVFMRDIGDFSSNTYGNGAPNAPGYLSAAQDSGFDPQRLGCCVTGKILGQETTDAPTMVAFDAVFDPDGNNYGTLQGYVANLSNPSGFVAKRVRFSWVAPGGIAYGTWERGNITLRAASRQPLSFLTGKEPGGMYLFNEVDMGSLADPLSSPWQPLLAGYDYDFELIQPNVAGNGTSGAILQLTPDGGTTVREQDFTTNSVQVIDGSGTGTPQYNIHTGTNRAWMTDKMGIDAFNGMVEAKIRNQDSPGRTVISVNSWNFSGSANVGTHYVAGYDCRESEVSTAFRLVLSGGATWAEGKLRVYRRNRNIGFSG